MSDVSGLDRMAGTRMGNYVLERLLGAGGMGRVYCATGADGERVALKLVKEEYARDATFRRRFAREARIAQTVKHPNVVPVLATGEHNGVPYMAQRYIDGEALDARLHREGHLEVAEAVRIVCDIAAGLEALWAAGMVHRDVKPGNILLHRDGTAYITDFGLAKDSRGTLLTLPGQALGSMDYMSPEQIRGEPVTARSDVYALGCVVFECMCGRPPFADAQGMRILWAHLQEPPPDPLSLRGDLSPAFSAAMVASLAKEPDKRPASAGAYARGLAQAAAAEAPRQL